MERVEPQRRGLAVDRIERHVRDDLSNLLDDGFGGERHADTGLSICDARIPLARLRLRLVGDGVDARPVIVQLASTSQTDSSQIELPIAARSV